MYQALYRKYRPRSFEDVVGQIHVTETLRRQVETGRLSHAYLFVGTRGTGKTTCAKILSRALNCKNPQHGNPCNECPACLGIESGAVMDVVEIDAASNNGVDNIRAIRDEAIFTPASVKKRVYIVDEVHMLSQSAFNALLKILEEPPEHLVFILATTELRKIPATILSRCQRFSFKRIMPDDIAKRLAYVAEQEGIFLAADAAALLSRLADGSMRDALSLLDQCVGSGEVTEELVLSAVGLSGAADTEELFRLLKNNDTAGVLTLFEKLYFGGKDPSSVLSELLSLIRDMLMVSVAPTGCDSLLSGACTSQTLSVLSSGVSSGGLLSAAGTIQETISAMATARDKRTSAELCLIRLSGTLSGVSPSAAETISITSQPVPLVQKPRTAPAPQAAPKTMPVPWEDDLPPMPDDADIPPVEPDSPPIMPAQDVSPTPTTDKNYWDGILAVLKGKIDPPADTFLADRINVKPRLNGNTLTLHSQNDFILMMLDTVPVRTAVAEAAKSVLQKPVAVKVTKGTTDTDTKPDKLNELLKFGNVKFE